MIDLRCLYCKLSIANTCLLPRLKLAFLFHIILRTSTDVWFIFFCRVKPSVYLFCFFIIIISSAYNPENVGYVRLAQGYKSSILVSRMVFSTKRHYIYLSKCLLRFTRISNDKNPRSFFFPFLSSIFPLTSTLLARAPLVNSDRCSRLFRLKSSNFESQITFGPCSDYFPFGV